MSVKRVFLLLVVLFFSTKASSVKILASDIDTKIRRAYSGLKSFSVNIVINIIDDRYKYFLAQDQNSIYIEWQGVDNTTYTKEEDIPVVPLNIKLFTNPYHFWVSLGIDTSKISYDYVNHVPCLVIGDKNRIFIDIEHFSIRKIKMNNISYLFNDFMCIGNYYLPHKIEIVCSDSVIKGNIEWVSINQLVEKEMNGVRGPFVPEPLIHCFPRFSEFFR